MSKRAAIAHPLTWRACRYDEQTDRFIFAYPNGRQLAMESTAARELLELQAAQIATEIAAEKRDSRE